MKGGLAGSSWRPHNFRPLLDQFVEMRLEQSVLGKTTLAHMVAAAISETWPHWRAFIASLEGPWQAFRIWSPRPFTRASRPPWPRDKGEVTQSEIGRQMLALESAPLEMSAEQAVIER